MAITYAIRTVPHNRAGKWDKIWEEVKELPIDGSKRVEVDIDDKADAQRIRVSMSSRAKRENPPYDTRTHLTKKSPKIYTLWIWKKER